MFDWFQPERWAQQRTVRLDRKHLEARARRFLKSYLAADEARKPQFYRAVEETSKQCHPARAGIPQSEIGEDAQIAEATSAAAMKMVLAREKKRHSETTEDRTAEFVTDACATVAIAYHRAAGTYNIDDEMQELGTAAVHLLTMATSYMRTHGETSRAS